MDDQKEQLRRKDTAENVLLAFQQAKDAEQPDSERFKEYRKGNLLGALNFNVRYQALL